LEKITSKKVCLIILDGWGFSLNRAGNAIFLAGPRNFDNLWQSYGHAVLSTHSNLQKNNDDSINSQICYTQISAGRFVKSESQIIADEFTSGNFLENEVLNNTFLNAISHDSNVHFVCPIDESEYSLEYIYGLLKMASSYQEVSVYIHLVISKDNSYQELYQVLDKIKDSTSKTSNCIIASIFGSDYSAYDITEYSKILSAYNAIIWGEGKQYFEISQVLKSNEEKNVRPHQIEPSIIVNDGKAVGISSDFDNFIFSSVTGEPVKMLFISLANGIKSVKSRRKFNLKLIPFADYLHTKSVSCDHVFKSVAISPNLSEIISKSGIGQFHVGESINEDEVSFYFNGRISNNFPEEKIMIVTSSENSAKNHGLSSSYIAKVTIDQMMKNKECFIVAGFANVDYFAHTKDVRSTALAVAALDDCLKLIYDASIRTNTTLVITGSHGNAENMARSANLDTFSKSPVPFIVVSPETRKNTTSQFRQVNFSSMISLKHSICDIAPTILNIMDIKIPSEFSGRSLINYLE